MLLPFKQRHPLLANAAVLGYSYLEIACCRFIKWCHNFRILPKKTVNLRYYAFLTGTCNSVI